MQSESARVNTAAEYRFRVDAANSTSRTASLVALDAASSAVVIQAAARAPLARRVVALSPTGEVALPAWLQALPDSTQALIDDAERSDMVVMVAQAGFAGHGATLFGEACRLRGVTVTALVLTRPGTSDDDLSATLSRLRPFACMIVVATGRDYVEDMLQALRA